jgi:hypothetical protein
MSSLLVIFVWGGVAILYVLNLVLNSRRIWYTTQLNTPPPPTAKHCLYTVHLLWEGGGGGEVREKVEGQQYTRGVPSSMGATVHKLGRKYQP